MGKHISFNRHPCLQFFIPVHDNVDLWLWACCRWGGTRRGGWLYHQELFAVGMDVPIGTLKWFALRRISASEKDFRIVNTEGRLCLYFNCDKGVSAAVKQLPSIRRPQWTVPAICGDLPHPIVDIRKGLDINLILARLFGLICYPSAVR